MRCPALRRLLVLLVLAAMLAAAGTRPAAAQDAPGYYAYVAAESEDAVYLVRFDGQEAVVAETIPVGRWPTETEGPHGLAVAPDGAHWYLSVAHGQPFGRVEKFETATDEKVGEVEVGMFPATMAVSPATGLLYVANFALHGDPEPSSVSVVDPERMVEVARVETGVMPHGARLAPGGMRLYSVGMMDGTLYEVDAGAMAVMRRLDLTVGQGEGSPKPTWVHPHPTRPLVYVALNGANQVAEVDTEAWAVTRRFETPAGPYNLEVSPDGATLVVSYKGAGSTGVWDLDTGTEMARVPNTRRVTHGVAITPDSRYAFVTAEGVGGEPGAVDVVDLVRGERVTAVAVGKQAGGVAFWKHVPAAESNGQVR